MAQLVLTPSEAVVRSYEESTTVFITHDGKPVLPDQIKKITSGVHKTGNEVFDRVSGESHFSDYSYMFEFETHPDGSITITPRQDQLQVGSYELFVQTIFGTVQGLINANLRESIPVPPVSPPPPSRLTYAIKLPDYPHYQEISLDLGEDNKNTYTWYIDGEVHDSGLGKTSFRAKLEIGEHVISFTAVNPEGAVVSSWSDTVNITK